MKQHDHQPDSLLKQLMEQCNSSLPGKIWRGTQTARQQQNILDTGYPELNQQLHIGGWPLASTTELGLSQPGIGELRLLLPALRKLAQQQHIICIAPPYLPFAPALLKEGIDVSKLIIVQSSHKHDTLWASEQALLAGCCAAVLSWTGRQDLSARELRRLQLAAEKSGTWNVLFRHSDCLQQASASTLRLHLTSNTYSQLEINVLKQPGGWGGQHCSLSLAPHYENWQRLSVDLLPQHNQAPTDREPSGKRHKQHQQQSSVTLLTPVSAVRSVH